MEKVLTLFSYPKPNPNPTGSNSNPNPNRNRNRSNPKPKPNPNPRRRQWHLPCGLERNEGGTVMSRGRGELVAASTAWVLWQNHLNYPGSSVQAITRKATPAQTHLKRNNSWSVG